MRDKDSAGLSVVICTSGRPDALRQCLQGIGRQTVAAREVIVVENGTADERARDAARESGARYLHSAHAGLSIARNQGWLASQGEVVAYIDDDGVPEKNWIAALTNAFNDPEIMAVGGRIIPPTGDETSRSLCTMIQGEGPTEARRVNKHNADWFSAAAFGRVGTGGNMAFRRSLMDTWTGFDERLGLPHSSCEDLFAFLQIADLGHEVAYVPEAVVQHPVPMPNVAMLHKQVAASPASAAQYFMFLLEDERYRRGTIRFLAAAIKKRMLEKKHQSGAAAGNAGRRPLQAGLLRGAFSYMTTRWGREAQERAFRSSL